MFRDIKFFTTSTLIHFGLLLLISFSPPQSEPITVDLQELGSGDHPGGGLEETIIIPKGDNPGDACVDTFGGIGLSGFPLIESVYEGYPAFKAGLKAGDVIHSREEIRGKPGTKVEITVTRGDKTWSVVLIREEICVK
jgi:S1-C subfamily serine protease